MKEEKRKIDITSSLGEKALEFLQQSLTDPLKEGTGIITDKIEYFRFKNKVTILLKAKEFLKSKGIKTPKKAPIKDLTTLLAYSSFEDNEKMQDKWSSLLANTLNPKNTYNSCHLFSQILNQLSINEIDILNYLYGISFFMNSDDRPYRDKSNLIKKGNQGYELGLIFIDNLSRLKLIEEEPPKLKVKKDNPTFGLSVFDNDEIDYENFTESTNSFRLSKFGQALIDQINF